MPKMFKNLFLVPAGFSRHVFKKGIHAAIHQESNRAKSYIKKHNRLGTGVSHLGALFC